MLDSSTTGTGAPEWGLQPPGGYWREMVGCPGGIGGGDRRLVTAALVPASLKEGCSQAPPGTGLVWRSGPCGHHKLGGADEGDHRNANVLPSHII